MKRSTTYQKTNTHNNLLTHLPALLSLTFVLFLSSFILIGCDDSSHSTSKKIVVGISQIIDHEALDQVREAALKTLEQHGYIQDKTIKVVYLNAQGNLSSNMQIAQRLVSLKPDVILAISTPSAQAIQPLAEAQNIPVVFAAVTDAREAHLTSSRENPDKGMTGIEDRPSIEAQLSLIQKLSPNIKKLGILYNPGESNSTIMLQELKTLTQNQTLELVEGAISKPADLSLVFLKLAAVVDALYVPLDNTIVALMPQLSTLAIQRGIPLIAADSGSVRQGALATYGFSYTDCGNEAGLYMLNILHGKKIKDLPIKTPKDQGIYINKKTAEALHLTLDLKNLGTLKEVIE